MPEPKEDAAKNFLIVEDNEKIRNLYKILIDQKYNNALTSYAENGKEGIEACKATDPTLIIADIKMPVMDGIEFHRHLKEKSPHLANRVAFISAGFRNAHHEYMETNKCKYLEKPFEIDAFHQFIDSILVTENIQTDIKR